MSTGLGVATSGVSAYAQGGRLAMAAGKLGKKILGNGDDVAKSAGKSVDDLIKGSTPGKGTKGRTKQFDSTGGFKQAKKEFDALGPKNVRDIDTPFGPGRAGTLPDGRNVNVRPGSSNGGPPSLEIQQGEIRIKFRFYE
jgi:hypothetical protein